MKTLTAAAVVLACTLTSAFAVTAHARTTTS